MYRGIAWKGAVALAALGMTAPIAAATASATPPQTVLFKASNDGSSAGWASGPGSAIKLSVGPNLGSYALVELKHHAGTAVSGLSEPTFSTDNYNAGSPRYYITLSNGDSLWGYPPNTQLNSSDFEWAINNGNSYQSWGSVQAAEPGANVTGVEVIADGDQMNTTDTITSLTFDGTTYTS